MKQSKKKSSVWGCVFPNSKKGRAKQLAAVATGEDDIVYQQKAMYAKKMQDRRRALVKGNAERAHYLALPGATITAQRNVRRNQALKRAAKRKQAMAKIQPVVYGVAQRNRFLKTRKAVVSIQSRFRKVKAIRLVDSMRQERRGAITIQSAFRRRMAVWHATSLKEVLLRDLAATKLQSVVRRRQAMHRLQLFLEIVRQVRELIRGNSAIAIQAVVRSFQAQGSFLAIRKSTIAIQSVVRSFQAQGSFLASRNSAIAIQSVVRSFQAQGSFLAIRKSTIAIQAVVRSFQAQGSFLASRKSTIAIQAVVRSSQAQGSFLASRNAVVKVQTFVRSRKATRKAIRHAVQQLDIRRRVKMVKGARKIQRFFRKWTTRQFILVVRDWAMEYREHNAAKMVIAGFVRNMKTRQFVLVVRDWAMEYREHNAAKMVITGFVRNMKTRQFVLVVRDWATEYRQALLSSRDSAAKKESAVESASRNTRSKARLAAQAPVVAKETEVAKQNGVRSVNNGRRMHKRTKRQHAVYVEECKEKKRMAWKKKLEEETIGDRDPTKRDPPAPKSTATTDSSAKTGAPPMDMTAEMTVKNVAGVAIDFDPSIGREYHVSDDGFGFRTFDVPHDHTDTKGLCFAFTAHYILGHFGQNIPLDDVKNCLGENPTKQEALDYLEEMGLANLYIGGLINNRAGILKHTNTGRPLLAFAQLTDGKESWGHAFCYFAESKQLVDSDRNFKMVGKISTFVRSYKRQANKVFEMFFIEKGKLPAVEIKGVYEIFPAPQTEGAVSPL